MSRSAGRHTLSPREPATVVDGVDTPSMNAGDSYGEREARTLVASTQVAEFWSPREVNDHIERVAVFRRNVSDE